MKEIAGYLVGALLLTLLGGVCLIAGRIDRHLAGAQEDFATLDYQRVAADLDEAEALLKYAGFLPWIGLDPLKGIRARRAAVSYWQEQYDRIVEEERDPVAMMESGDLDSQFIIANAMYRERVRRAKDREALLQAIDAGIDGYVAVLKSATRHEDAAFNYEYLVKARAELAKNRRLVVDNAPRARQASPHGRQGAPAEDPDMDKFKIHVPLDPGERQKGEEADKSTTKRGRG
jgi:hypothetical protein